MNIPKLEDLGTFDRRRPSFKKHYPELYEHIVNTIMVPNNLSWAEAVYWYYHDLKERPVCKLCGGPVRFLDIKDGYTTYCKGYCAQRDSDTTAKIQATTLKHWGVTSPMRSKKIRQKHASTMIERYGKEHALQVDEILERQMNTCVERYGHMPLSAGSIRDKRDATCIERYGTTTPAKLDEIREKLSKSNKNTYSKIVCDRYDDVLNIDGNLWLCKCPHAGCNKCVEKTYNISARGYWLRKHSGVEPCTNILPYGEEGHSKGTNVEIFVRNILDELNIKYKTNVRDVIPPKELDIYIPSLKIAIECNGLYWHSSEIKDADYHTNKWKACKNAGVQLLSVWEDWIRLKPEIIKSILINKLRKNKYSIGARECQLKTVSKKEAHEFLENNHIQGDTIFRYAYGLYKNDKLISLMTFGKKRKCLGNKNNEAWELSRFCNKRDIRVIGGAGRLFNKFITDVHPDQVISYSACDISNGNLYKELGFISSPLTSSYWYVDPSNWKRYHRTTFSKSHLIKRGMMESGSKMTEREVMAQYKFVRIYDSGQIRWTWTK